MGACASLPQQPTRKSLTPQDRVAILRRSQVGTPTDVSAKDIRRGPAEPGAFPPGAEVKCEYVDRKLEGNTPKFECAVAPRNEIKVKYGLLNGEVYGEVAGTRLLWALGFGADRMYPVRVVCHGCPNSIPGGLRSTNGDVIFDPAAVERKAPGRELETREQSGWAWKELDLVDEAAGGAPLSHRDALKLLAVLIQHTDSKSQQQRLVCLDPAKDAEGAGVCAHPFMLINDLGLTFGRSDFLNRNTKGSVNFERWSQASVWKNKDTCVGNLGRSMTGTLNDPVISEAGRAFLANLLNRLTDAQIHDLFDVARVTMRPAAPDEKVSVATSVDDWVAAFKQKREEIASRRCVATQ